ncbi:integrase [Methylorubrum populi]|uniref:DUF6538 domain-containing protein n=1 Tax=Methylorubrum rhodesianum TaxID=29427 RepID=UPI00190B8578|nr:DUF6538 domain-containing protein [Methylorubrum rhodesianum]MBK3405173.1 integrase [Methylorubrum rhodesianum]MBY0138692.1 integrase [Methylorubrum populi]
MVLALARPWRHPKTGMYWFRRRVPKDLRFLLGRTEERKTLETKEPGVARVRYLRTAAEVEERWARIRSGEAALAATAAPAKVSAALSNEDASGNGKGTGDAICMTPVSAGSRQPPAADAARSASCPWRPVFEEYAAEARLAPSTVKRWSGVLTMLEEAVGSDDLAALTRQDLIAWKASLLRSGRNARTVRDAHLAAVKAVANWAVANARLAANPASGIAIIVPKERTIRDRDLTDAEALLILRAASGPPNRRLSPEHAAARRWVPWLCAYGGARVNEITQMRGRDVRCERGIWLLRITPEAGTVKTGRWRDVPLHPHLVEQGFIGFVRERGTNPLFYDPARARSGSPAHPIYKKVGERLAAWVRSIGVDDPGVDPNHGWRHRFKTIARHAGIRPDLVDAIQGHAPRTDGEQYGRFPPEALFEAICRFPRYPDFS